MLSVIMLSVIMLNVVMLGVVAPEQKHNCVECNINKSKEPAYQELGKDRLGSLVQQVKGVKV